MYNSYLLISKIISKIIIQFDFFRYKIIFIVNFDIMNFSQKYSDVYLKCCPFSSSVLSKDIFALILRSLLVLFLGKSTKLQGKKNDQLKRINPYICTTLPLIFQTMNSVRSNNLSLKY